MSFINGGYNSQEINGKKGLAFTVVWGGLLVLAYAILGCVCVYSANGVDGFTVGVLIGMGAMLVQLYFILMFQFYMQAAMNKSGDGTEGTFNYASLFLYFLLTRDNII